MAGAFFLNFEIYFLSPACLTDRAFPATTTSYVITNRQCLYIYICITHKLDKVVHTQTRAEIECVRDKGHDFTTFLKKLVNRKLLRAE